MRDSMVFYRSFADALAELPAEEYKEAVQSMLDYALDGKEPDCNGVAKALFIMAKPQIDANNKRYENGKKGGKRTKPEPNANKTETKPEPNANQEESNPEPNDNVNVNVNVNDNVNANDNVNDNANENVKGVKGGKHKRFIPPAPEDVMDYAFEKGLSIDAEKFCDYYESNGWKVGRNPMKDWRAAVRNWAKRSEMDKPRSGTRGEMSKEEYLAYWGLDGGEIFDTTGN